MKDSINSCAFVKRLLSTFPERLHFLHRPNLKKNDFFPHRTIKYLLYFHLSPYRLQTTLLYVKLMQNICLQFNTLYHGLVIYITFNQNECY